MHFRNFLFQWRRRVNFSANFSVTFVNFLLTNYKIQFLFFFRVKKQVKMGGILQRMLQRFYTRKLEVVLVGLENRYDMIFSNSIHV